MKVVTGKVVDGRVEVQRDMAAEGSLVTLLVSEPHEGFERSPEVENELVEVMAEAERGDLVDGWKLLRELKAEHCAFGDLRHRGWGEVQFSALRASPDLLLVLEVITIEKDEDTDEALLFEIEKILPRWPLIREGTSLRLNCERSSALS